jgi:hypothetical protein
MGNRGIQAALMAVVVLFGVIAAVAVNGGKNGNQTATVTPTATATASAQPTPSEGLSPSPSASAEATPSPSPSVEATPAPAESTTPAPAPRQSAPPAGNGGGGTTATGCSSAGSGGSGPSGYPAQIQAGRSYSYCGPRAFVSHATDSGETADGVCAGINESTQAFPGGYEGVFFVGVQFGDGQIVSAGYIRSGGGRQDFASVQNGSGSQKAGTLGADPGAGSHTYCVKRSGSQWAMTRDSTTIYQTSAEPATTLAGATLKFDADVETVGQPGAQDFTFTVPGFQDIAVGGQPPRQLRGAAFYS